MAPAGFASSCCASWRPCAALSSFTSWPPQGPAASGMKYSVPPGTPLPLCSSTRIGSRQRPTRRPPAAAEAAAAAPAAWLGAAAAAVAAAGAAAALEVAAAALLPLPLARAFLPPPPAAAAAAALMRCCCCLVRGSSVLQNWLPLLSASNRPMLQESGRADRWAVRYVASTLPCGDGR